MPPPAEGFASRLFLAPALRTQPDRRLVTLVREGYEVAFEEIVRRYGKPLSRYAASIVGGRCEDVTQDAFSKALLALRRDDAEIDLRPWLFRIVRNTALNDLRDRPPSPELLAESLVGGGGNPAEELERREELADLMRRLQALPEAQRAAIVMRELEGLSHDEIARALGMSGGAARQAIYRARRALRDGVGMLVPLPLLQSMLAMAATPGAGETAAGAAGVGAAGAGVALKATAATVLVAGAVGAGVTVNHGESVDKAAAVPRVARESGTAGTSAAESGSTQAKSSVEDELSGDDQGATGHGRGRGRDESGESARHVSGSGSEGPGRPGSAPGVRHSGRPGPAHDDQHGEDGGGHLDDHGSLPDDRSGRGGHDGGDRAGAELESGSHSGPGPGGEEPEPTSDSSGEAEALEEPGDDDLSGGDGSDSSSGSGSGSSLDEHTGSGDSSGGFGLTE